MGPNDYLDHSLEITLRDLLDLVTIEELAEKIFSIHGVGLILFSPENDVLIDTITRHKSVPPDWDVWKKKQLLKQRPQRHQNSVVKASNKTDFAIVPIVHELDAVGYLGFGPFPENQKATDVERLCQYFSSIFEVIVFTSMKRHLTNMAHIASITESYKDLEKANQELQMSFEKLKEIDQMKSNFLAVVSHELRTPLTSVIGYSEMLLEQIAGPLNDSQRNYVLVIMEKADQLLNLIKEILNLSKIEAGKIQISRKPASPREIAQIAYETILPMAEKKTIAVVLEVSEKVPRSVCLDAEKMLQVFNNLLSNAVKFTDQNGSIRFSMDFENRAGNHLLLCKIKDSGIGVAPENIDKIFEKFFQVDNTSTRAFGGTGLGLSIVKSFVDIQEGKIWLESTVGRGTTFFLEIPVEEDLSV